MSSYCDMFLMYFVKFYVELLRHQSIQSIQSINQSFNQLIEMRQSSANTPHHTHIHMAFSNKTEPRSFYVAHLARMRAKLAPQLGVEFPFAFGNSCV